MLILWCCLFLNGDYDVTPTCETLLFVSFFNKPAVIHVSAQLPQLHTNLN